MKIKNIFTNALPVMLAVVILCMPLSLEASAGSTQRCKPAATGSFIQSWLIKDWSDARWDEELTAMKKAGIDTLILGDTAQLQTPADGARWDIYYPSTLLLLTGSNLNNDYHQTIDNAMRACERNHVKVYLGLGGMEDWFNVGADSAEFPRFCQISAKVAKDLYNIYYDRYSDIFAGWYIVTELHNDPLLASDQFSNLVQGFNTVIDALTAINPKLPVMMSPFYNEYGVSLSLSETKTFWTRFFDSVHFRSGDIFAPQDSVGAGWVKLADDDSVYQMYRQVVDSCDKGIVLWANCENFTEPWDGKSASDPPKTENADWITSTLDRYVTQMKIASKYCDNIITFSWNHYYSPYLENPVFNNTYLDYLKNGVLETQKPAFPDEVRSNLDEKGNLELTWTDFKDNIGIAYYRVYKNGSLAVRNDMDGVTLSKEYTDTAFDTIGTTTYEIEAVDGAGNVSDRVVLNIKGSDPNKTFNFASSSSQSFSSAAGSSSGRPEPSSTTGYGSVMPSENSSGSALRSSSHYGTNNPYTGGTTSVALAAIVVAAVAAAAVSIGMKKI